MTNANPARGQKPRRKTAREMHAEQPKFQAGQRVAVEIDGRNRYGKVSEVATQQAERPAYRIDVEGWEKESRPDNAADGFCWSHEADIRLARPTPQLALEHARRQFDEAVASEDRYTGWIAKARAEIADAVKRLAEVPACRVGDEMAELIEGVAEASAFLKLVDWLRPMDEPGDLAGITTREQYREVLAAYLERYTSEILNRDGYRHSSTRESSSITNRAEFKALQEARKFLAWQLHRLDTVIACERWIAEGRQEIPEAGQDSRPERPNVGW
jgi:hypothetical protein